MFNALYFKDRSQNYIIATSHHENLHLCRGTKVNTKLQVLLTLLESKTYSTQSQNKITFPKGNCIFKTSCTKVLLCQPNSIAYNYLFLSQKVFVSRNRDLDLNNSEHVSMLFMIFTVIANCTSIAFTRIISRKLYS